MSRIAFCLSLFLTLTACASGFGSSTPKAGFGYAADDAAPSYTKKFDRRYTAAPKRGKKLEIPKTVASASGLLAPGKPAAKQTQAVARDDKLDPSQYQDLRDKNSKRKTKTSSGTKTAKIDRAPKGTFDKARKGAFKKKRYNNVKLDAIAARDLINAYRREKGLKPVALNSRLTKAAMAHSRDLARFDRISHHGSDGSDPWDRVKRSGYRAKLAAENVGTGQANLKEVFKGWQNSPGHNANLLLKDATEMGIALVYDPKTEYRTFWTLVLGSPL